MDDTKNAPVIIECEVFFFKWHNTSISNGQNLIADKYVEIIDVALDKALTIINFFTFGLPNKPTRYLSARNLTDNLSDLRNANSIIERAICEVKRNWEEVLAEAKDRLGELFDKSEYPDPNKLCELYGINCDKFIKVGTTTTLDIYQEYSLHHYDLPEPDLFEIVEWVNEIEAKRNRIKED